jgi:hypothetical protein
MIGNIPDSAAEMRARGGVASLDTSGELQHLDPDGIAPFICYLASDYAQNINAQTFLVYGNSISLMSQPRSENAIYEPGGLWNLDDLAPQARDVLTKGVYNPAPAPAQQ